MTEHNMKVVIISDKDFSKYSHFVKSLEHSQTPYNGIVAVKSLLVNKRTNEVSERIINMTY